jgi:Peptidase family M50
MRRLGRFLQFCFGLQAVTLVFGVPKLLVATLTLTRGATGELPASPVFFATLTVLALCAFAINGVPVVTWWVLKKGKRSARTWALVTSLLYLPVPIASWDGFTFWSLFRGPVDAAYALLSALLGFTGLLVFSRFGHEAAVTESNEPEPFHKRYADHLATGTGIFIASACFIGWIRWGTDQHLSTPGFLGLIVQFQLAALLATLCHELGHAIAGWASDMKLRSFQIGPFQWAIRDGNWRFAYQEGRFAGGSVAMAATHLKKIRSRRVFQVLGGPVASLLTAAVCGVTALSAKGHGWEPYWTLLGMAMAIASGHFVANLFQLLSRRPWADVDLAFLMVTTSQVSSIRPKDWDIEVLRAAGETLTEGQRGMLLQLYCCMHYLEAGRIPEALLRLQVAENLQAEGNLPATLEICARFVFVHAVFNHHAAAAQRWWQRIEGRPDIEFNAEYWNARACVEWLRGETDAAVQDWENGRALAHHLPVAGAYQHIRWCFDRLRDAMDSGDAPESEHWVAHALSVPCSHSCEHQAHATPRNSPCETHSWNQRKSCFCFTGARRSRHAFSTDAPSGMPSLSDCSKP